MKTNVCYQGDCLEVMKGIPSNSIDCIITDPPYGTKTNQRGDSFMIGEFSNVLPLVLPEIYRVLKSDGAFYCFTSWTQMSEWLLRFQQYFKLQNILVWDKQRHSGCYSPSSWQFTWEGIFFGIKGKRKVRDYQRDVLISNEKGKRVAMQKPVDIIEKMILASTDDGMTILDPFSGSGSTLLAAKNTNRNYIGIEISEEYCDIIKERVGCEIIKEI
jgi:DNA modification methylase